MAMIPYDLKFCDYLTELIIDGEIPMERVDDAVRRILKVKRRAGLFERPLTKAADYPLFGSAAHAKVSYDAAAESITLLKNEGILPLDPLRAKILVTGPNANSMRTLDGGWSYSWQGTLANDPKFTGNFHTILAALRNRSSPASVLYQQGVRYIEEGQYYDEEEVSISAVVQTATSEAVGAIVLVVGENSYTEKPGDLQDLQLSDLQLALAEALLATQIPVILVLNEGRPRIISQIVDRCAAVVQVYLPANYGGDAFADILYGRVNPSGKLPYTYPRYRHSIVNYWHKLAEEQTAQPGIYNYEGDWNPQWEFGFGLSYTQFNYSNLVLSSDSIHETDTLNVSVTVTNVGKRPGKEAVLLFISDLQASTAPDVKRLRNFKKIDLAANEYTIVQFQITVRDLSFINADNRRVAEPGEFTIAIGPLKRNFILH
jgi:beta-glucosidase